MKSGTVMRTAAVPALTVLPAITGNLHAFGPPYDDDAANRTLIRHGVQAVLTCNGLFTSQRTPGPVFGQKLKFLSTPAGTAAST